MTASVDMGILKNRIPEYDQFGIGIMGYSDKAGNGALNSNYLGFHVLIIKRWMKTVITRSGAGFQGTYMNKRLNHQKLTFEDQLTPIGFTGVTRKVFQSARSI
jgi:hypothetical protein